MTDIQRELEPLGKLIHSGLVYGSLGRDIDIFLVVDDEQKVEGIREELSRISGKLRKFLDIDLKKLDDVERRILYNDFYLGSVFRTRKLYLAGQGYLERAERTIFQNKPTDESISSNFLEGCHILDISLSAFYLSEFHQRLYWHEKGANPSEYLNAVLRNSRVSSEIKSPQSEYYLGESVRNLDFSIGYLIATKIMRQRGELVDLNHLLSSNAETPEHKLFIKNRKDIERYRSGLKLDSSEVRDQIEETKRFYEQYGAELNII